MAKRNEPRPKTRKLSETLETITVDLTPDQIDEQHALASGLRDRIDQRNDKIKALVAEHKGQQKELEEQERAARRMAATGKRDIEVMVEDWLEDGLDGVRVVRRRADTMEQVGEPRTVSAAERQEVLPMSGPPDDSGFGSS